MQFQVLVGNKSDMKESRVIPTNEGENLAKQYNIPFFETSAKTGSNVEEVNIYNIQHYTI